MPRRIIASPTTSTVLVRPQRSHAYETARPTIQALVPESARRILDLGCARGALGAALKARQGAEVVGIELDGAYAADASAKLDHVVRADLNEYLTRESPGELGEFDCIIAADVLEHLTDPWTVLSQAVTLLVSGGVAIVSLPNIRHWRTFVELGWRGTWPRQDAGIFDRTHLRWFTLKDAEELLVGAGLRLDTVDPEWGVAGWHRPVVAFLRRTPLKPFLPPQYVLRGTKSAARHSEAGRSPSR